MDKKLNFTDLCNFYAKAAGVPAAEAESFVHAFFEIVVGTRKGWSSEN